MHVGQEDLSQVLALAGIWLVFLALGCSACLVPLICTADLVFKDPLSLGLSYNSHGSAFEFLSAINAILFIAFGSLIGYPIATASGKRWLLVDFALNIYTEECLNTSIKYGTLMPLMFNIMLAYFRLFTAFLAIAAVGVLKGLWRNDLVALKGACPNCGEEVC